MKIYIDFETRSKADLKKCGSWAYSCDPSTEILCMAYAYDDNHAVNIFKLEPHQPCPLSPEVLSDPAITIHAHNVLFERAIWENIGVKRLGWPQIDENRWRCTAAKAAAFALPRSLEGCAEALKLPIKKDMAGRRAMLKLSKPRKPTKKNASEWHDLEEDYLKLYEYCMNDVAVEREIDRSLRDLSPAELQVWQLDQKINLRGVAMDRKVIDGALSIIKESERANTAEASALSEGAFNRLTERAKVVAWLQSKNIMTNSFTKKTVEELLLREDLPAEVRRVLEIRQETGKTSTAKYVAMKMAITEDDRIRDTLVYHGASTGRWAGKIVQFQNVPRGNIEDIEFCLEVIRHKDLELLRTLYGNPMNALSSALRSTVVAAPEHRLLVADYSAIEARVVFWYAQEESALEQFRVGADIYKDMAAYIFDEPVKDIAKDQRHLGKTAILGCGFGMGAPKFLQTCLNQGQKVTEELAQAAVSGYRQKYPRVPQLWYDQGDAAKAAIRNPGKAVHAGKIMWALYKDFLHMRLPSGRLLSYYKPTIEEDEKGRDQIMFWGVNSVSKKWQKQKTYGGMLVENMVQATARDVMALAMLNLEAKGYPIVLSIHDEVVAEVPNIHGSLAEFCDIMRDQPSWASGLPLAVEGFEAKRYRKG